MKYISFVLAVISTLFVSGCYTSVTQSCSETSVQDDAVEDQSVAPSPLNNVKKWLRNK